MRDPQGTSVSVLTVFSLGTFLGDEMSVNLK